MFLTLFPPIKIDGTKELELSIEGLETLKQVHVTPEKITVLMEKEGTARHYDILTFNNPIKDVHKRIDPGEGQEEFPLELMPLITIEFLEMLALKIGGYTLISNDPPEVGFGEFWRGDRYPISIRGSRRELYPNVAELKPMRRDYIVALEGLLNIDFEEQLENSLATFIDNVLKPMTDTMNGLFDRRRDLDSDEAVINIIGSDFKRLITRTEELISIVNYNMNQTSERNKAFLRLTLPLMAKQALIENYEEYFDLEKHENLTRVHIKKRKSLTAEEMARITEKMFS
ncbi:MAG: hypothetical protein ACFFE8_06145 [Candidatus Heimdallarchaeota archaeon]